MDIRPYSPTDRDACLEIFDSNLPQTSRPLFESFLDGAPVSFYVAEHDSKIVACGGFEISGETARLQWGMVHSKWQRQGLGRFLLFYRLREITRTAAVQMVNLECPRQAVPFFASQGFREVSGGGSEAVMVKRLAVCP